MMVRQFADSTPSSTKCCVLEQDTLSTMLSTDFNPGRHAGNTQKMSSVAVYRESIRTEYYE